MRNLGRLAATLYHLPPGQLLWRAWKRLCPRRPSSPLSTPHLRPLEGSLIPGAERPSPLVGAREFVLLGEAIVLDVEGWTAPARSSLVRYNLHYFDCAGSAEPGESETWCRTLIDDWIAANPPGTPIAWDPYPISLRIVNWLKLALRRGPLSAAAMSSLVHQARWLEANLEHDIKANHLFANAKALLFAGLALTGPDAGRWLRKGRAILLCEAVVQQLADGAHFERSPMYHALFVEDLLDLVNLATCTGETDLATALAPRIGPALRWLEMMTHPDGEIAFFNDAATGIAARHHELVAYASRLGIAQSAPPNVLGSGASGYHCLGGSGAVILADIAPVGPDCQPGHAHADTLSFEMSLGGQRVIVNSGTSLYGLGAERERQRGTAAHSTLQLCGRDSSEVWSGFRVGRRARARVETKSPTTLEGSHDGYRRLPGRPLHSRRWTLGTQSLTVTDQVTGGVGHAWPAQVRYHLHPDIRVERTDQAIVLHCPDAFTVRVSCDRDLQIADGTWHPRFNATVSNRHLLIEWEANHLEPDCAVTFTWGPLP